MTQRSVLPLLLFGLVFVTGFISVIDGSGAKAAPASPNDFALKLTIFAAGFERPVGITNAGSNDGRLFVIEKAGRIKIILPDGSVAATPFLDITDRVESSANEHGLLGLTFHPNYAENGLFFVNYIYSDGQDLRTRISRFRASADPGVGDPGSEIVLLTVDQPNLSHNAGDLHFGQDGYLYIPLGDGGSSGDPHDNAQNPATLLGKVIRIDVNANDSGNSPDCVGQGSGAYTIPDTNPFIDEDGYCEEIWAMGLRNPWQSSFDRLTGDFYIGDVGQGNWEEINFQPVDSVGGENYGWRCYEGNHEYNSDDCQDRDSFVFPIFEYPNPSDECASVIGGYVYRGADFSELFGLYLLTDFCSGTFWTLEPDGDSWLSTEDADLDIENFVAFGEDSRGEIYLANIENGAIYRLSGQDKVYLPALMKQ